MSGHQALGEAGLGIYPTKLAIKTGIQKHQDYHLFWQAWVKSNLVWVHYQSLWRLDHD